jgi:hypothetical protein
MAHHLLYRVNVGSLFQMVACKTVAKRMYPLSRGDTGFLFGVVKDLLSGCRMHVFVPVPCEKQPLARPVRKPICLEQVKCGLRQNRIPVFSAFSLFHPDQHPVTLNVLGPQAHDFAYTQSGCVCRHQQRSVFEIACGIDDPVHLLEGHHLRQLLVSGAGRNMEFGLVPPEQLHIKAAVCRKMDIHRAPRQFFVPDHVKQVFLDLVVG